ncbi:hypothetical protein BsIDN1_63080 [Bacillus safensis]|uniref:Uncharacterized protein n=1 Tax=Bacillus safensis TaxID=561879 RepID=A0A5S9MGR9_BACIA|nr:hypothetical protein BsIDN1_63080 [Bacillus safensis]
MKKKKVEDTLDQSEQHETMASMDVPDMDYYFIMGDVPKQDESLTKSLKARIKPLADQHKRTAVLTLNYDANVKERIHSLEETFPNQVDILNVFEHYILPESGSKKRRTQNLLPVNHHIRSMKLLFQKVHPRFK